MVVVHGGEVVAERYGTEPDTAFGPGGPVTADTTLVSWSTAKSIVHAAVGILVGDGAIDVDAPAPVAEWAGTEKAAITLLDLLEMRPGLRFVEDYVDGETSHCIDDAVRRRRERPRRLRRGATPGPSAWHGVELLVGHDQHHLPDPRRRRRRRRGGHARVPARRACSSRAG